MILTSLLLAGGRRVQVGSETTTRGLSSGSAALFAALENQRMIVAPTFQSLPTESGPEARTPVAGEAEAVTEGQSPVVVNLRGPARLTALIRAFRCPARCDWGWHLVTAFGAGRLIQAAVANRAGCSANARSGATCRTA